MTRRRPGGTGDRGDRVPQVRGGLRKLVEGAGSSPASSKILSLLSGSNSVVESQLPKLLVAGSIPVSRSTS